MRAGDIESMIHQNLSLVESSDGYEAIDTTMV